MELTFGIRMDGMGGEISLYGIDEVNAALEDGATVRELKSEGASLIKVPNEDPEMVSLIFAGGGFTLIMEPSNDTD